MAGLDSVDSSVEKNAQSNPDPEFSCLDCCGLIRQSDLHFDCGEPHHHRKCLTCFGVFVRHSCEQSLVENTLPICCPIPECKSIAPPHEVTNLIPHFDLLNGIDVNDFDSKISQEEPLEFTKECRFNLHLHHLLKIRRKIMLSLAMCAESTQLQTNWA
jgi:hypothetical protein